MTHEAVARNRPEGWKARRAILYEWPSSSAIGVSLESENIQPLLQQTYRLQFLLLLHLLLLCTALSTYSSQQQTVQTFTSQDPRERQSHQLHRRRDSGLRERGRGWPQDATQWHPLSHCDPLTLEPIHTLAKTTAYTDHSWRERGREGEGEGEGKGEGEGEGVEEGERAT